MTDGQALAGLHSAFASLDPEPLLASPPALIEFLPLAVYACDASGRICWSNAKASQLWGRSPPIGEKAEQTRAGHRIYGLDGLLIADGETPLARALRTGESVEGLQRLVSGRTAAGSRR